jgi:hypothetical protein
MRKGQLWTLDMALSLLIFFSAMLSLLFAWNYISADTAGMQELREVQLKAMTLSDSLIRTPGLPADWNESTVRVVGLAYDDNTLDPDKVGMFVNMSYAKARSLLGVHPYHFYFEVKDINGTLYKNSSLPIDSASTTVVPAERYAVYGGRITKVLFALWL